MDATITQMILRALQKNQSVPEASDSGVIAPETYSSIEKILNINPKKIPVAINCEIAPMINIRRVGTYRCMIPSGTSIANAMRLANQRNIPTRAILSSRKPKKYTTEKWKIIQTKP